MKRNLYGLTLLVAAIGMSGCASGRTVRSSADDPTAPTASGARQTVPAGEGRLVTDQGVELRFDSKLGVYIVEGETNRYYLNGVYYLLTGQGWFVAIQYDGPWQSVGQEKLPPGLRSKTPRDTS